MIEDISVKIVYDISFEHPFLEKFNKNRKDPTILNPISWTCMEMISEKFPNRSPLTAAFKKAIFEYEKNLALEIAKMITMGIIDLSEIPIIKKGER